MQPTIYTSFLIRLWREHCDGEPDDWCGQIEHIQSGASWSFATLDEALRFLRQAATDLDNPHPIAPDP